MTTQSEKEPTQEQLQKFWEWCGFTAHKINDELWRYETFKETNFWWTSPDSGRWRSPPTLDLNNLFKYAVPKLRENHWWVCLDQVIGRDYWRCQIVYAICTVAVTKENDSPTLALFWAIWEAKSNDRITL